MKELIEADTFKIEKEDKKRQAQIQKDQLANIKTTITDGVGGIKDFMNNTISSGSLA